MKFIETLCGHFVNINHISRIEHELSKSMDGYYSYIYLNCEKKLDFIELTDQMECVDRNGKSFEYKLHVPDYILLHKYALELISDFSGTVLLNKEIEYEVYKKLEYEIICNIPK